MLQDDKVYYIYADHLNTPRRVATSDTNQIVWKWDSKPFGEDKPTGTFTLNLRFPGQYFDKESGFSYNINRYYNPSLGRYMQSDPIGLDGGENSFVYVGDNPVVKYDLYGQNIITFGFKIIKSITKSIFSNGAKKAASYFVVKGLPFPVKKIWGKTADDIAESFLKKGYEVVIRRSTKGSKKAVIVKIKRHPNISQIQIHPGGGRHGGAYYKISTTQQGIIKIVDKKTYIPTPGEKATIIYK